MEAVAGAVAEAAKAKAKRAKERVKASPQRHQLAGVALAKPHVSTPHVTQTVA